MAVVKDLRSSFNPVPKGGKKKTELDSKKKQKEDLCIMPKSKLYSTVRTEIHCERHEVYFSKAYRQKSINDGLIVFLTRQDHRGTNRSTWQKWRQTKQTIKTISRKSMDKLL